MQESRSSAHREGPAFPTNAVRMTAEHGDGFLHVLRQKPIKRQTYNVNATGVGLCVCVGVGEGGGRGGGGGGGRMMWRRRGGGRG